MHGSYLILCTLSLKSYEYQLKFHTVLMVPANFDIQSASCDQARRLTGPEPDSRLMFPGRQSAYIPLASFNTSSMAVVSRPLTSGIYAPVPSFFLPQSEDLGTRS